MFKTKSRLVLILLVLSLALLPTISYAGATAKLAPTAGITALLDGPEPGPTDIIAGGILGIAWLYDMFGPKDKPTTTTTNNNSSSSNNNDENKNDNNKSNLQKVDDKYLKKKNIDAHEFKKDYLGREAEISKYDIYVDKNTGRLYILRKNSYGPPSPTNEFIK